MALQYFQHIANQTFYKLSNTQLPPNTIKDVVNILRPTTSNATFQFFLNNKSGLLELGY